tara:strand:- start:95 stop:235 length:141 start_codon:yes stop_codon:yes gene_type:complete
MLPSSQTHYSGINRNGELEKLAAGVGKLKGKHGLSCLEKEPTAIAF